MVLYLGIHANTSWKSPTRKMAVDRSKELSITLGTFFTTVLLVLYVQYSLDFLYAYVALLVADAGICVFLWFKISHKRAPNDPWKTAVCSHGVGLVVGIGVVAVLSGKRNFILFGIYMVSVGFFHISEYVLTAMYNAGSLSIDSFLINHSPEYIVALTCSVFEYWVELYFVPWTKDFTWLSLLGFILIVVGEGLRKAAMITARSNFTHIVQYVHRSNHVLVTHGVYSISRHPSYMGFFYWSIGTQALLCNPVCLAGFTIASWLFFDDRIQAEEELLLQFFEQQYVDYKQSVGVGIPFIKGYPI